MFEDVTYDKLLSGMLAEASELFPDLDIREGSVLYTALAPAAVELQNLYIALDTVLDMSFPDTAAGEYLIRRCSERGITPFEATYPVIRGTCQPAGVYVPNGTRFSCGEYTYAVTGTAPDGAYQMRCETAGAGGNLSSGTLLPLSFVEGLKSAEISGLLIPGEDQEDTEALRKRYYESLESQSFGGNVADYREKVNAIDGVGGVKVYAVWDGGGTVKLVIIAGDFSVPSDTLIDLVQERIDPTQNAGEGVGLAPIGHVVTVVGACSRPVDVSLNITYQNGWTWEDIEPYAEETVDAYFRELAGSWADSDNLIVRISQIETRLLELAGILDIADTTLNGDARNLVLDADVIPVRGAVSG